MNSILERSEQMPYYTDLKLLFEAFQGRQTEYNWLITNLECNHYPDKRITYPCLDVLWLTGNELTEIVQVNDIQFFWGVLSGLTNDIILDIKALSVHR